MPAERKTAWGLSGHSTAAHTTQSQHQPTELPWRGEGRANDYSTGGLLSQTSQVVSVTGWKDLMVDWTTNTL